MQREGGQFYESAVDIGQTVLGILLGNKRTRAARSSATVRRIGKAARERSESQSAQEALKSLMAQRQRLLDDSETELQQLKERFSIESLTLYPLEVPCRKSDTRIDLLALVWIPWAIDASGRGMPLVDA